MTVLTTQQRIDVMGSIAREISRQRLPLSIVKADLQAAVDALDTFFDTNAAAINAAIPLPARTSLTVAQKALLVTYIILARYT